LDSSDIAAVIQAWNPNKLSYLPLFLDLENTATGFSLRLCVELGYRLLCIVTPAESRKWLQTNWMALLVKNLTISQEQVFTTGE
jgi:hypothetical protein